MTTLPENIANGSTGHWSHSNTLHVAHNKGDFQTVGEAGVLFVQTGAFPFVWPFACTLLGFYMRVSAAPTGASIIVDVNKASVSSSSPTTIFPTAQTPRILATTLKTASLFVPDTTAVAQYDWMTFDIDQVGSTIPGSDLSITISYIKS